MTFARLPSQAPQFDATTVLVDPSAEDWQPECVSCGKLIERWNEAVGLAASTTGVEDDEPGCMVFAHIDCPESA